MRPRRLLALVPLTAAMIAATLAPMLPAYADVPPQPVIAKPTVGWAADWHFTDSHSWTLTMSMPYVTVVINGYDGEDLRTFSGTVTDTSPDGSLCAYLTFAEAGGAATYVACGGTVSFYQLDPTPSTYTFTTQLKNSSEMWRATSVLTLPTTETNTGLRAAGNGAWWSYVSPTQVNYGINRNGAIITGNASGHTTSSRSTVMHISASVCNSTRVNDNNVEVGSKHLCAGQSGQLTASGMSWDFEVKNCLYSAPVTGEPSPRDPVLRIKCVPLIVM